MTETAVATEEAESKLDPFTAEIIRSYLLSTVREMYDTTIRTAYSTCFSEGEDFTCAIFDPQGRMIAQAYGLPAHSGALVDAMENILESFGELNEGDIVVHNDPYNGGTHQADVVICRPMFIDGEHLGFSINRGHWTDVGGMAPGGWCGTARHVIQEALIIPAVKLYERGVMDRQIRDFIIKNVRLPKQCWGDIQAQIASDMVAERRVQSLVLKYGLDAVKHGMSEAIEYSRRRFARMVEELPDGDFHGSEIMEDDGHGGGPYTIRAKVTKKGHNFVVDFHGTDPQVLGPVNVSFTGCKAAAYSAVLAVVDPDVPMNSGVLDLIEVRAEVGSMVRPTYPAPVFSWADPTAKTSEAVLKAMVQIAPERVAAGTYCTGNNVTASGEDPETGEEFLWYHFGSGGCGARPTKDGNTADWHLMANCKNESMEIWEALYPVEFEGFGLVTDSGGAGQHRGGLGIARRIRMTADTRITGCADRHQEPSWGIEDGGRGTPNRFSVTRDGVEYDLRTLFGTPSPSKFTDEPLLKGDIFTTEQGGGGGYGSSLKRDPKQVADDVRDGYVSAEKAREDYGAWIDGNTGDLDEAKTLELRERLA